MATVLSESFGPSSRASADMDFVMGSLEPRDLEWDFEESDVVEDGEVWDEVLASPTCETAGPFFLEDIANGRLKAKDLELGGLLLECDVSFQCGNAFSAAFPVADVSAASSSEQMSPDFERALELVGTRDVTRAPSASGNASEVLADERDASMSTSVPYSRSAPMNIRIPRTSVSRTDVETPKQFLPPHVLTAIEKTRNRGGLLSPSLHDSRGIWSSGLLKRRSSVSSRGPDCHHELL
eukprot:jgi/Mesvir1/7164/Mv02524-RA.1